MHREATHAGGSRYRCPMGRGEFRAAAVVATIYLGWHFFVDVLAGFGVGAAAFVLAAKATGNPLRRRAEPWTFRAALEVAAPARDDDLRPTRG